MNEMGFPIEIKKALTCLGEESRQKIALGLIDEKLTYTELKKEFEFTNGNLNHHLLELTKAGIINRYLRAGEQGSLEKYYTITDFGKDLLQGIFTAFAPTSNPESTMQTIMSSRMSLRVSRVDLSTLNYKKPLQLQPFGTTRQIEELMV